MKTTSSTPWRRLAGYTLAAAAFALPLLAANPKGGDKDRKGPAKVIVDERPPARDGKMAFSFAPVVKKVSPSVVTINTLIKGRSGPMMPELDDPMLRRFFGEQFGNRRNFRTPPQQGAGSGVIVSEDG